MPVYLIYFLMASPFGGSDVERYLPFLKPETRRDVGYLVDEFFAIIVSYFRGQAVIAACQGTLFGLGDQLRTGFVARHARQFDELGFLFLNGFRNFFLEHADVLDFFLEVVVFTRNVRLARVEQLFLVQQKVFGFFKFGFVFAFGFAHIVKDVGGAAFRIRYDACCVLAGAQHQSFHLGFERLALEPCDDLSDEISEPDAE